jgi:hypothetical protein
LICGQNDVLIKQQPVASDSSVKVGRDVEKLKTEK